MALHQNKNDEHARGHIGTELNNKAETILQVEVDKEDKAISVVEAVHIRDRDFEPFAFRINEDVLPELVEPYLSKEKKSGRPTKEPFDPEREIPETVHRAAVDAAQPKNRSTRRRRFRRLYIVLQWMPLLPMAISAVTMTTWNV